MIATADLGKLLDAAALLAGARGQAVAVVSNARGAGVLVADACGDAGLQVADLTEETQRALRALLPQCRGGRAGRYHGGDRTWLVPPVPGTVRCRPRRRRDLGADGQDRDQRPGSRTRPVRAQRLAVAGRGWA